MKTIDDTKFDLYAFEMLTVGETNISHDQPSGSHDQSSGSHDQPSGSHDQSSGSHDQQEVSIATHSESTPVISVDHGNNSQPYPLAAGCSNGSGCSNDAEQGSPPAKLMKSEPITVVSEWHCCAICLEELLDTELKGHSKCGASICDTCLQVCLSVYLCMRSVSTYASVFMCVCHSPIRVCVYHPSVCLFMYASVCLLCVHVLLPWYPLHRHQELIIVTSRCSVQLVSKFLVVMVTIMELLLTGLL